MLATKGTKGKKAGIVSDVTVVLGAILYAFRVCQVVAECSDDFGCSAEGATGIAPTFLHQAASRYKRKPLHINMRSQVVCCLDTKMVLDLSFFLTN